MSNSRIGRIMVIALCFLMVFTFMPIKDIGKAYAFTNVQMYDEAIVYTYPSYNSGLTFKVGDTTSETGAYMESDYAWIVRKKMWWSGSQYMYDLHIFPKPYNGSKNTTITVYNPNTGSNEEIIIVNQKHLAENINACAGKYFDFTFKVYDFGSNYISGQGPVKSISWGYSPADGSDTPVGNLTTPVLINNPLDTLTDGTGFLYYEYKASLKIDNTGYFVININSTGSQFVQYKVMNVTVGDHQYDDGVITTAPTETREGVLTKTCSICGDTITESIPKIPYDLHMNIGDKQRVKVVCDGVSSLVYEPGVGSNILINSSDVSVAGANSTSYGFGNNGLELDLNIFAKKTGNATITVTNAKNGTVYGTANVSVAEPVDKDINYCINKEIVFNVPYISDKLNDDPSFMFSNELDMDLVDSIETIDSVSVDNGLSVGSAIQHNRKITLIFKESGQTDLSFYDPSGNLISTYHLNIGDHNYSLTEKTEATCLAKSKETYTCEYCGESYTEEVGDFADHNWSDTYTTDVEPTCTSEGQESIHCTVCEQIKEGTARVVAKLDHTYSDWIVTKPATCTEDGVREQICSGCGDKITETIAAKGHIWKAGFTVDKEATCEEAGVKSIHCSVCDILKEGSEREIPATGHQWEEEYTVDVPATCTDEGSESIHCSVCDVINEETVRTVAMIPHTYGEWNTVKESTCSAAGSKERICTVCGHKDTEEIPIDPENHKYGEWITALEPTCTEAGREERTCSYCNNVETNELAALGHHLTAIEAKEPTEFEEGNEAYWHCDRCDKCFKNAAGTEEVAYSDLVITKLININTLTIVTEVDDQTDWVYTGNLIAPEVNITGNDTVLLLNEDYTLQYSNNTNVGTASMTITGIGKYCGVVIKQFEILPKDIKDAVVTGIADSVYTGDEICPEPTVSVDGTTLLKGNDYIVEYKDNINPGTATVTIKGKGNYTGTIEKTFKITGNAGDNIIWSFKDGTLTVSGTGEMDDQYNQNDPWYNIKDQIKTVVVEEGITRIGFSNFYNLTNLKTVYLPKSLVLIRGSAFRECPSIEELYLYGDTKSEGAPFWESKNVKSIHILDGSKTTKVLSGIINGYNNNKPIEKIYLPEGLESISDLYYLNITSIDLPDSLIRIEDEAFYGCALLKKIVIPDSVISVGDNAFRECSNLEDIVFSNNLISIGGCAFLGCSSLTNVIIPDSVTSIGWSAFENCTSLTSIVFPKEASLNIPLSGCNKVEYISGQITDYSMAQLFGVSNNMEVPKSLKVVKLTGQGKTIKSRFFESCSSLTNIILPDGIKTIEDFAFLYCTNLENIEIPNGVTSIGYQAFCECKKLKSIQIPPSVTYIGDHAFYGCQDGFTIYGIKDSCAEKHAKEFNINFVAINGWKKINGYWYYYDINGKYVTSKWMKDSKGWCYLGADGCMVTNGWAKDSKGWCWIGSDGYMVTKTQWVKYNGSWYYIEKGYMAHDKWAKDAKGWCYLASDGKMVTNDWVKDSKGYCWIGSNGYMPTTTQWVKYDGGWYHITKGYRDQNKWMKDSQGWCWLQADGRMLTNGWAKDSKGWCWIGDSGYMVTDTKWIDVDGVRYYIKKGYMAVNCWAMDDVGWLYLESDGLPVTSTWKKDTKGWCYVGDDGYMVTNDFVKDTKGWCWIGPDGYMIEEDMWIGEAGAEGSSYIIKGYRVDDQTIEIDGVEYTFDQDGKLVG